MAKIEDLLQRRTDLSTFLVHLTRGEPPNSARENLLRIAEGGVIEARSAFGPAERLEEHLAGSSATQKAVCFTETPLEHVWMMLEDIEGRSVRFEPYGIALTKTTARKAHCNPVWYSDISTRGGHSWPMFYVNALIDQAEAESRKGDGTIDPAILQSKEIFRLTPFFEQMGPTSERRREFWWEREWRHVDDFVVNFPRRLVALLVPEKDHAAFRNELEQRSPRWAKRPLLDPRWGLERMIAELAGLDPEHIGPFPDAY